MGFDIHALDLDGDSITYFRGSMSAFRLLRGEGYDWFAIIGAEECDGGVSGTGACKRIARVDLERALEALRDNPVLGPVAGRPPPPDDDDSDELGNVVHPLMSFMVDCIAWCEEQGTGGIEIDFE